MFVNNFKIQYLLKPLQNIALQRISQSKFALNVNNFSSIFNDEFFLIKS